MSYKQQLDFDKYNQILLIDFILIALLFAVIASIPVFLIGILAFDFRLNTRGIEGFAFVLLCFLASYLILEHRRNKYIEYLLEIEKQEKT